MTTFVVTVDRVTPYKEIAVLMAEHKISWPGFRWLPRGTDRSQRAEWVPGRRLGYGETVGL